MDKNITKYIQENRSKYSKEDIVSSLRKAGYKEQAILECINMIYGEGVYNASLPGNSTDFWDFKSKKIYKDSSEKWKDFLLGLLGPWLAGFVFGIIPFIGIFISPILFIFEIFAVIYLFKRRKFISYGLITNFALGIILIIGAVIFFMSSNFSF